MPRVLQFGMVTFKNINKNYNKENNKMVFTSNQYVQKYNRMNVQHESKYPVLLYAKNQTPNNVVYKGQVFQFDQQKCNSYIHDFPTNSSKLLASMGSSK